MEHIGIVVDDLDQATEFFHALGLQRQGGASVEGDWVDRVVGLEGVQAELVMLETPDGNARLEMVKFQAPPSPEGEADAPANAPGLRHISFLVEDIDEAINSVREHGGELVGELEQYRDIYRLCYVRGPAGVIVELAEEL